MNDQKRSNMREVVIADTSSLIVLEQLNLLPLLDLQYDRILITPTIQREFEGNLPDWIEIREAKNTAEEDRLKQILDPGESTAIALAQEIEDCEIILDDLKARKNATQLGLNVIGTIAILERGYDDGFIPPTRDVVGEIDAAGFRVSNYLKDYLRKKMK